VWSVSVPGDWHGALYQYQFESYGVVRIAPDINGFAASADSRFSLVVDLARTNPPGGIPPTPLRHQSQTDAVLYELHIRDFTIRPESGVAPEKRGKYAGLAQAGTRVPGTDFKTGLDYLVSLGVTDVHLLPVQNFLGKTGEYNWGYVTNLFNVPEETYSTTPGSPVGVIREFKAMVAALHRAGLRVVLDVVYNHTWPPDGKDSAFDQTVPYYYFRTDDRGYLRNESGVGNALHDERPMVRKFVRESLLYWQSEYGIDGFRFDLLGMFHPESVRDWTRALRQKRPDTILYGEPWTGGGPTRFPKGAQRGTGMAVFNDDFRNIVRGDLDGTTPGFALGGGGDLRAAIAGGASFATSPQESVNYVSAHDNLTLWDKITKSLPPNRPDLHIAAVRLALATVLLSQGVPFLEGGVEIGRTKGGNPNSYNAGDSANAFDWERATRYGEIQKYVSGLIHLRRGHRLFRLPTQPAIHAALTFLSTSTLPPQTTAFTLTGQAQDSFRLYLVLLHGGITRRTLKLPPGKWHVLADHRRADTKPFATQESALTLEPLSAYVLAQ
jgi:pullulanase